MGVMLTNFNPKQSTLDVIRRFDRLPFKHKVVFTGNSLPQYRSSFYLKNFKPEKGEHLWEIDRHTLKRHIDKFDIVKFINTLCE